MPILKYGKGKKEIGDNVDSAPKHSLAVRAIARMTRNSPDVVATSKVYQAVAAGTKFAVNMFLDAHTGGATAAARLIAKTAGAAVRIGRGQEESVRREMAGVAWSSGQDRALGVALGML